MKNEKTSKKVSKKASKILRSPNRQKELVPIERRLLKAIEEVDDANFALLEFTRKLVLQLEDAKSVAASALTQTQDKKKS